MLLFVFFLFSFQVFKLRFRQTLLFFFSLVSRPITRPVFYVFIYFVRAFIIKDTPFIAPFPFWGLRFFQVLWAFNSDSRLFQYHHSVD